MTALERIPVGVVIERRKAASQWIDFTWRPAAILGGTPVTAPWTLLSQEDDAATFYAGAADIELFRSETSNYRDNLAAGGHVWVVLRSTDGEPPYQVFRVTVDPSEGEAYTEAGNDIVDAVPMPANVREIVAAFVAEHHVEQPFYKRKRKNHDPDALGRRPPDRHRKDGTEP